MLAKLVAGAWYKRSDGGSWDETDFFPGLLTPEQFAAEHPIVPDDELLAKVEAINLLLGGSDLRSAEAGPGE